MMICFPSLLPFTFDFVLPHSHSILSKPTNFHSVLSRLNQMGISNAHVIHFYLLSNHTHPHYHFWQRVFTTNSNQWCRWELSTFHVRFGFPSWRELLTLEQIYRIMNFMNFNTQTEQGKSSPMDSVVQCVPGDRFQVQARPGRALSLHIQPKLLSIHPVVST